MVQLLFSKVTVIKEVCCLLHGQDIIKPLTHLVLITFICFGKITKIIVFIRNDFIKKHSLGRVFRQLLVRSQSN